MEQPPPQSAPADDEEAKRQEACKRLEHIMAKPLEVVEPFPFETLDADLRRNVLTFVLTAPTDGVTSALRVVKRKSTGKYPRVPESATMALRTLVHHTRTMKAVSTAVCADVRVLEKTVVKPEKWLEGLWLVEAGTRDQALAECRQRIVVAGRANAVVELYSRLGHCSDRREEVVKCPATWPEQRASDAKVIFDLGGRHHRGHKNQDVELSWAHVRCKPPEEVHALAPVDAKYFKALASAAFGGFVDAARHLPSWTLLVTSVKLLYIGGYLETRDDNGVLTGRTRARTDAADYDALDAGLAAFFGEETVRRAPWVKAWCNGSHATPYDEEEFAAASGIRAQILAQQHDASRPPLTRIRDADKDELLPMGDLQLAGNDFGFVSDKPLLSAATIDITFADDAEGAEQAPFQHESPNSPPSYTFIQGIDSLTCRGGGTCGNLDDVKFKIKTHVHSRAKNLEDAILWVPIVEGVFQVLCGCKIVGLS
jgi:hypothetical protein